MALKDTNAGECLCVVPIGIGTCILSLRNSIGLYCGEPLAISRKKSIQVVVRTLPREDTVHPVLNMAMSKSSKMLHYVNYRMRVTIQDSRTLVGTFMAFDKVENVESLHII